MMEGDDEGAGEEAKGRREWRGRRGGARVCSAAWTARKASAASGRSAMGEEGMVVRKSVPPRACFAGRWRLDGDEVQAVIRTAGFLFMMCCKRFAAGMHVFLRFHSPTRLLHDSQQSLFHRWTDTVIPSKSHHNSKKISPSIALQ